MSNRPDILVRVGAAFDRSFDAVLASVPAKMERAFGAGGGARKGLTAIEKQSVAVAKHIYDTNSKLNAQVYRTQAKSELELAKLRMRLDSDRNQSRQREARAQDAHVKAYYKNIVAEHQRAEAAKRAESKRSATEVAREERAQRMAGYRRDREIERFATRTSHRATRFFFPPPEGALGYMKRTALDVARGAGVDFSLGGGVARAKEREMAGMGLAQQERIANAGQTRGAEYWTQKSLDIGTSLGVAPEQVTEMIRSFTGKTGDFNGAVESARELAELTLASGANMGEMGSAAGFVYNQLKGMPDAGKLTLEVMRGIVGQTAVGAVEMEEYASQMGRIAANAKMFKGDVSKNILELSALTQLSIAEGGATSGADAARSIAAFANTTSKGQRINAFKKHGVQLFNKEGTQKRPILDIIKDSLIASKGNIPAMTQMWADTLGQKPIRGLTNAFNEAGGGEAGWKAALAKIKPFMDAQLDPETQKRNVSDYQKTTTARAQAFQNSLDRVTESMSNRLLPTLEKAAPHLIKFTEYMGMVVNWAAENPGKAIVAAITASIGRAGLESVGRLIIDRVMASFAGNVLGSTASGALSGGTSLATIGASGGAVTGIGGVLGAVAGLAAVGVAAYSVTTALLELNNAFEQKNQRERARSMNDIYFEESSKIAKASNPLERQQILDAAIQKISTQEEKRTGTNAVSMWSDEAKNTMRALRDMVEESTAKGTSARQDIASLGVPLKAGQAITTDDLARAMAGALIGKTMEVKVRNVEDFQNFTPVAGAGAPPGFYQ